MDFFMVPTITVGVLLCFFVISHDRRRMLHLNVTRHPTSRWIVQQLREAFPYRLVSGDVASGFCRPGSDGGLHPIPACLFGAVQGFVGGMNDLLGSAGFGIRSGNSDADGHR